MNEPACTPVAEALRELDRTAPGVPLLALGQTVFWDETMKGGLVLALRRMGSDRRLVAGVHDTDYLAKLPSGPRRPGEYAVLAHNDTTTRGLWSAAAEFSSLFGSETVVTRETLRRHGVRVDRLAERPGAVDAATEAWGWRGVVSRDEDPPITAEAPLDRLFPVLREAFDRTLDESLDLIQGQARAEAEEKAVELRSLLCEAEGETLGALYRDLLPKMYAFAAGRPVDLDVATTTELLRFSPETAGLPRFRLLDLFLRPETREIARRAYDRAIEGGQGQYPLARFGTGALPFDVVIPGRGRGTLRVGTRGVVIETPEPCFLSLPRPLSGAGELAERLAAKFGPGVVVVGKAVALLGMLGAEHVFVFHEGASSYAPLSARLLRLLAEAGHAVPCHPVLRVAYDPWTALRASCTWLRLPGPLQGPFGTDELCAPSFAARWRDVADEGRRTLARLAELRRPVELVDHLDARFGGAWHRLAEEYRALQAEMETLRERIEAIRTRRRDLYARREEWTARRIEREAASGAQWRAELFDRDVPAPSALARREVLQAAVAEAVAALADLRREQSDLAREQRDLVASERAIAVRRRRREIELEADLRRVRMIREAILVSRGLPAAARRPAGWWFPLLSPDGLWFRETTETARAWLEPLG